MDGGQEGRRRAAGMGPLGLGGASPLPAPPRSVLPGRRRRIDCRRIRVANRSGRGRTQCGQTNFPAARVFCVAGEGEAMGGWKRGGGAGKGWLGLGGPPSPQPLRLPSLHSPNPHSRPGGGGGFMAAGSRILARVRVLGGVPTGSVGDGRRRPARDMPCCSSSPPGPRARASEPVWGVVPAGRRTSG